MANVTNPWAVTPYSPWGAAGSEQTPFGYGDEWSKWLRDGMLGVNAPGLGLELGLSGSDYGNPAQQQNVVTAWLAKMQQQVPEAYRPQLGSMAQQVQRDWYANQTANRWTPQNADDISGTLAGAFGSFNPSNYFQRNRSQFGVPNVLNTWRFL